MSDQETLIKAEDLRLVRGEHVILEGVTLSLQREELITVIGPNGGGKTTLLRALLGLIPLSSGHVWRHQELRMGYMPQSVQVVRIPMTVERFLLTATSDRTAVGAVLEEVHAEKLGQRPLAELSGGEFQRVLLARVLLRSPNLLVLDEPMTGVDHSGQAQLYRLIDELKEHRRMAVIMSSHDLHVVMASSARVVCLNRHVCCTGKPAVVLQDEAFSNVFGEGITEQLALYRHNSQHDHGHSSLEAR